MNKSDRGYGYKQTSVNQRNSGGTRNQFREGRGIGLLLEVNIRCIEIYF